MPMYIVYVPETKARLAGEYFTKSLAMSAAKTALAVGWKRTIIYREVYHNHWPVWYLIWDSRGDVEKDDWKKVGF